VKPCGEDQPEWIDCIDHSAPPARLLPLSAEILRQPSTEPEPPETDPTPAP
jgi:hypothetical protein